MVERSGAKGSRTCPPAGTRRPSTVRRGRAASDSATTSIAVKRAVRAVGASMTVCAPTPQPASSTRLPAGYRVSWCSSSTSAPAWSCRRCSRARVAVNVRVGHAFPSICPARCRPRRLFVDADLAGDDPQALLPARRAAAPRAAAARQQLRRSRSFPAPSRTSSAAAGSLSGIRTPQLDADPEPVHFVTGCSGDGPRSRARRTARASGPRARSSAARARSARSRARRRDAQFRHLSDVTA